MTAADHTPSPATESDPETCPSCHYPDGGDLLSAGWECSGCGRVGHCPTCNGSGVRYEQHDGGQHPIHCGCTVSTATHSPATDGLREAIEALLVSHLQPVVERILTARLAEVEQERDEAREAARLHEHGYCEHSIEHNKRLAERLAREKARADALVTKVDRLTEISVEISQERDRLAEQVAAVLPAECWVLRASSDGPVCTDMIGGGFPNGAKFTEEMCCVPCRIRAALDRARGLDGAS